jgi:hypothetical protein
LMLLHRPCLATYNKQHKMRVNRLGEWWTKTRLATFSSQG